MKSLEEFIRQYPFFSMLVFICIGFLLRSIRRINLNAVRINIEALEFALEDEDIEQAKYSLQRLKSGFGL
ncbi:hypothetical protein [Legionella brunensis]|uniref:Uncharacterized protein n=1 Tax=Legionella brunensis TaxID=29422 RepID=A0A0W0SNZ3_9GAMM|nr:hypothetical protein [Legionella brunensis]KTC85114.1 hypothetical protein Lbru_0910 [Legionella brunensis]